MAKIVSTGRTISLEEYHNKRVCERRRRFFLWFTLVFLLVVALVLISRIEKIQISDIQVEGAKVVAEEDVRQSVLRILSGRYFWLVPKGNVALYPRAEIEENLAREFSRFSDVALSLEGLERLVVSVVEREPFALYCPPEDAKCFFLDESGFIFGEAPDFSGAVYFIYSMEPPLENPKGREFLPEEEFSALSDFLEMLSSLGFKPVSLMSLERGFDITMKNGSRMLLPEAADLAPLALNLESFLKSENIASQKNFLDEVFLLDLRTKNKIFYRFRGE